MHCIDNIYIYTYIHTYIHTYNIYIYWIQESIYIFILHCRILTSPGAKRGAEAFENGFSWIPGQWSCRHTHTIISTLFEIYMFFHRSKSLSEQSEPLCCTYGRHWLVSTPVTYSICQWLLLFQLVWHPGCKVFVWWPLYKLSFWYTTSNLVPMSWVWCVDKGSMPRHRCSGR